MSRRPTVLIVDDEAAIREVLYEVLHTYGYSAITAATVQEAEEIKHRLHPETLGLVLTDVNLSRHPHGQEGYDLFQRWTAVYPGLPFVLMSADLRNQTLPAVRARSVRFLAKPFSLDALLHVLRAVLREDTAPTQ